MFVEQNTSCHICALMLRFDIDLHVIGVSYKGCPFNLIRLLYLAVNKGK